MTYKGKRILRMAVKAIKDHPETLDMGEWLEHDSSKRGRSPYCGTVACIAGHVVLAAGARPLAFKNSCLKPRVALRYLGPLRKFAERMHRRGEIVGVPELACKALGVEYEKVGKLFHLNDWPPRYTSSYRDEEDAGKRAEILGRRVEHFIEHGK